ncbi:MAG: ROK family protein [Acidobacteria bacterium]|nr:ROK family protein [Acidobacteriota bacterium]
MYYLGVDIGGTTVKAGLVNETGRILESRKTATVVDDLNSFLSKLTELILSFQKSYSVAGIGIGIPGFRNSNTHMIETAPNIPCLNNINLETSLADQVHIKVITENDANAGAYAEFRCGAGAGSGNMVYLTLGTGLGSGLILNGELFVGSAGYAGEFGHTVIEPRGRPCSCGNQGCIETVVSATAMVRSARERGRPEWTTSEMIFDAARAGDAIAQAIFEETGRYLGIACTNLMNLLNPDLIVIGGGVMACGEMLLKPARDEAGRRAIRPAFDMCPIVQSKLWPESGLIGAAMLARDRVA